MQSFTLKSRGCWCTPNFCPAIKNNTGMGGTNSPMKFPLGWDERHRSWVLGRLPRTLWVDEP